MTMDFRYTQDQQDLIDGARAFFEGEFTIGKLREYAETGSKDDFISKFCELGLMQVMLPKAIGGLDQPLEVMAAIAEMAGYECFPRELIHEAGITLPFLASINKLENYDITDSLDSTELLTPLLPYVVYPPSDIFVVPSSSEPVTLSVAELELEEVKSIDPTRRLFQATVNGEHNAFVETHGAVLTAAQLVGLSKRMLDMSVDYAKEREQFGKPIGSFQAIKHQLANVHTQIEFTRPAVQLAALQGGRAVHTAKVAAIDTAMLAAETAIQVHGGMGYTYEVDLHLFMKRAWALCGEWGDRNYHMKKLEDMILDRDADIGPGTSFAA